MASKEMDLELVEILEESLEKTENTPEDKEYMAGLLMQLKKIIEDRKE